ncbi:MAG TPA: ATP-grasp domain-containing protein [Gemmataceae bacterium]|nr:ATP-grasp domain-containing protein [Gemmataceae bacterium]
MRIGITFDLKSDATKDGLLPAPSPFRGEGAGGGSPDDFQEEFDSAATIDAIASVFRSLGHDVERLGDGRELLEQLLADPPDFVFNLAEGEGIGRCREARVPAVLEMLGIPYSGSDPLTLAVTLDKDCAKRLVASAGVAVPRGFVVDSRSEIANCKLQIANCKLPVIVKPAWEGSSKGIRKNCLVAQALDLPEVVEAMLGDYRQPVLVEEFIQGDELTVGLLGNDPPEVLGVMRVLPRYTTERFIYGVDIKRDFERLVDYECPPRLPGNIHDHVRAAAHTAYGALGCRDVSRIDFRLRDGVPYFLEVNPLPGLNPESSDLVIMARLCGWTYEQLIETILRAALTRNQLLRNRGLVAQGSATNELSSRPAS